MNLICPSCSIDFPVGRVAPGTPARCKHCGAWAPVPTGLDPRAEGHACPGCGRPGRVTLEADGRVFSCLPCSKSIVLKELEAPLPPPPQSEQAKAHVRHVWAIFRHEWSERRLPQAQRCAERLVADEAFRDAVTLCPTCRHGSPKGSSACGFCGYGFLGVNAAEVEAVNANMVDEIRHGPVLTGPILKYGVPLVGAGVLCGFLSLFLGGGAAFLGLILAFAGVVVVLVS